MTPPNQPAIRTVVAHPYVVYTLPWFIAVSLFGLHWSNVLTSTIDETLAMTFTIAGMLAISYIFWNITFRLATVTVQSQEIDLEKLKQVAKVLLKIWAVATLAEIAVSGGIPILWLLTGSSKNYMDFGVRSIHGFVISLLMAASLIYAVLGFQTGQRKYFWVPAFAVFWFIICITRAYVMVMLLEILFIVIQCKRLNYAKIFLYGGVTGFIIMVGFGILGDLRSPLFDQIAGITPEYPDWMPRGAIWMYLYLTTPIDNLIYTVKHVSPDYNVMMPLTFSQLLPSVIRGIVVEGSTVNGLLASVFNVSTTFVMPYQDFGFLGIALFAWGTMGASTYFWIRRDIYGIVGYAVMAQCALNAIFSNMFLNLSVVFQLVWFVIALNAARRSMPATAELEIVDRPA